MTYPTITVDGRRYQRVREPLQPPDGMRPVMPGCWEFEHKGIWQPVTNLMMRWRLDGLVEEQNT